MIPTKENIAKMKAEALALQKNKIHKKISNTFIESAIKNNTATALKTIYYLANAIETIKDLNDLEPISLLTITFDTREMLKYTELTLPEVKRNMKAMQETSITFVNEAKKIEEGINLLPYYKFVYGKHKIEVKIFVKIARMIVDVKRNYSMIDTRTLMKLKSKHSLRLLPMLQRINQYSEDIAKRKVFTLDELNLLFGTKYKRFADIQRKVLDPVKSELDTHSRLSFIYEVDYDHFDAGRPKAVSITLDVIDSQPRLF
jgi:plasmid replication initiation protein